MTIKAADTKFLGRAHGPYDLELVKAEGSLLYDSNGKKYIDFLAGWCVGNIGWGNKEMEGVIRNSKRPTYIYPHLLYKPWVELAELLAQITPGELRKSFRTTGGSESIEAAMQMAMLFTKRNKFLSIEGSYHGNTLGTLSIGSSANRKLYGNLLPDCYKINPPLNQKALEQAENYLKQNDIAAFIMEPVICNLGVLIPGKEFVRSIRNRCKKYGTLLVMDEVATGFGRTGKLFASEHFNIDPDILCLSKAITGGYAGMGVTMTTEKIAKVLEGRFNLYSTYGWHPLSVDVAIANIRYWIKNKKRLLNNVLEVSELFRHRIAQIKFKREPNLQISGLAIGIDIGNEKDALKLQEKCLKAGLLINAEGTFLTMFPALNLDKKTALQGLEILDACVNSTMIHTH